MNSLAHWKVEQSRVATGTGAVALRAARTGAQVSSLDQSPVLVRLARRLADKQGLADRFTIGDAEVLPDPDARLFNDSDGPARTGVATLKAVKREALRRDWVDYFERHRRDGRVSVPRPYLLILGRRRAGGGR